MRAATERDYKQRILRVLVHVQQHLDDVLELDALASVAHFSPYHFHRIFRGMVGESVKEHVRRLRLERAAHRLKFTEEPVTRIAFDAGYEAHEGFTRAFTARFGISPSNFRTANRIPPYPAAPSDVHFDPDGPIDDFHPHSFGGPPMDVQVKTIPPIRVAFIRHTGPYTAVGPTWGQLFGWAGPRGLAMSAKMIGVCYDDPEVTPPEKIRYDACITVNDSVKPEGEVGVQEIGGGEYAVAMHKGPYENLGQTYARLAGEWLPKSGREPRSSPCLEMYLNSPQSAAPADLLTEICMPLAAK
jgi:AraC family transcriptional regulator